nr:ribonuclease H-like domain-containing protein [Tanacetum cinerariifolium]
MLLTRLYNHILQTNPQAIVPLARFTSYERVMNVDISRNPTNKKGNRIASSSTSSSLSSLSDDNEEPTFLEFYEELSDNENLIDSRREKRGMFKCLNYYFGIVTNLMHKTYELVVTDDYSRYTWVFFLATKNETACILKKFITEIENLVDKKVKVIRYDNGTEFKNSVMNDFYAIKGIRREFSIARTLQQNGVAERKNRTLIEAARTMLVDSKLPTTFWAEIVNTACYVQNMALVVILHNKTPYELFRGRTPTLSFMRPFGCHVTILNTLDHLGKFDGKAYEGYFAEYSMNSKAFRMDVKSDFLYGRIEEEVYVYQPPGFEDPDHPDKVYKVVKALYGWHQAPRAVYVDEIIFGSTKKELCIEFERLMKDKFQMSSMGELTFFLGLQVKQKEDGIFISQDKYVTEVLIKFKFSDVKSANTPV